MAQVVVSLMTIDLRAAELQPVANEDVKTLQALLNLFLTAGDVGEDGTPIPPLTVDGEAGAKTKQAAVAFQRARAEEQRQNRDANDHQAGRQRGRREATSTGLRPREGLGA